MKIDLNLASPTNKKNVVSVRCPHCDRDGTFDSVLQYDLYAPGSGSANYLLGLRKCPNPKCKGQLFFIKNDGTGNILVTYPSEMIPFSKDNIPEKILNAFEEAIICHSNNCFIASGIMVRKTLEEICANQKVNGKNLYQKISNLGSKSIIPSELLQGMDELRIVGNNAAHVDAKEYDEIGKEEIEVSIDLTKEILKAVYQYESLVKRLRDLKNSKGEED